LNLGVSRNRFCDFLADPDSRSFSRFGAIIMQVAEKKKKQTPLFSLNQFTNVCPFSIQMAWEKGAIDFERGATAIAIDLSVPGNGRRRSLVESMPSREFRSPVRKQTFVPLFFDECFPFPPYVVRPELVLISQMMDQFQDKERRRFLLHTPRSTA